MHTMTSYHCIHPNPFQESQGLVMQVMVNQLSQQGAKRIYLPLDRVVRGYDPLDMVSFDTWRKFPEPRLSGAMTHSIWWALTLEEGLSTTWSSFNQATGFKFWQLFLVYPARSLKTLHIHTYISLHNRYPFDRSLTISTVYFSNGFPTK